jgi:hypothetical protein
VALSGEWRFSSKAQLTETIAGMSAREVSATLDPHPGEIGATPTRLLRIGALCLAAAAFVMVVAIQYADATGLVAAVLLTVATGGCGLYALVAALSWSRSVRLADPDEAVLASAHIAGSSKTVASASRRH